MIHNTNLKLLHRPIYWTTDKSCLDGWLTFFLAIGHCCFLQMQWAQTPAFPFYPEKQHQSLFFEIRAPLGFNLTVLYCKIICIPWKVFHIWGLHGAPHRIHLTPINFQHEENQLSSHPQSGHSLFNHVGILHPTPMWGFLHTTKQLSDTSWAFYNLTQFWYYLPGGSIRSQYFTCQSQFWIVIYASNSPNVQSVGMYSKTLNGYLKAQIVVNPTCTLLFLYIHTYEW